jgi:hypothetical protein
MRSLVTEALGDSADDFDVNGIADALLGMGYDSPDDFDRTLGAEGHFAGLAHQYDISETER